MDQDKKFITYKDKIVFGKQVVPYFDRMPKDYAENEACFVFVNNGLRVRTQEQQFDIGKKNAILAKCLNYFFETSREQQSKRESIEAVAVLIHPEIVEELFEFKLSERNYDLGYNIKQVAVDLLLENFKQSIIMLLDNPEIADDDMIKTKLREFILLISKSQNIPDHLDFLSGLFSPVNISLKSTINQNLYSNLSIEELAQLCHMSHSTFKRKFREVFKASPHKYISSKKIERAGQLLKTTDLRITEIAFEVGFDTLTTFERNFHSTFKISPSEYRLT